MGEYSVERFNKFETLAFSPVIHYQSIAWHENHKHYNISTQSLEFDRHVWLKKPHSFNGGACIPPIVNLSVPQNCADF